MTSPAPARRPRLRTRLALLHAGIAFASSMLVVAMVDLPLFTGSHTIHKPAPRLATAPATAPATASNLPSVLGYSAIALIVLAAVSIVLGWMIAGRALRPLRVITFSALSISAHNLENRLRVPAAYHEFTELADTLNGLLQRLHESFMSQRQFIANASHELRTPLTVQRALLQLTLADPDATADTLRSTCHELMDVGQQQEHLIDALLTLASSHQGVDNRERFDLADLTRRIVLDHHAEAQHRGTCIRTTLIPTSVTGDPRLITSLVTNLVDNALRHNIPGGTVEIATTAPGRLTVSNTGTQVPPTEIDRLFRPFQRLGRDRTDHTNGHGLGLAIIAAIAHAHRAPLTAQPRPDGGLHITIDFPPDQPSQQSL